MEELQAQLSQMRQALCVADPKDKPGLQSIICQLEELIGLSEINILHSPPTLISIASPNSQDHSLSTYLSPDDEFRKFKDEIAALEATEKPVDCKSNDTASEDITCTSNSNTTGRSTECEDSMNSIIREISALEGTKCSAPHQPCWGQLGYYNALILGVEPYESPLVEGKDAQKSSDFSMDSIMVRVAFTQPIVESMLPCPYYQENRCRFADNECKYSHGEIVSLSSLRDYKEPNFAQIVPGCKVLAKYKNSLWYPATVLNLINEDGQICEIKYDEDKETIQIPLHDATPLESYDENSSSDSEIDFDDSCEEVQEADHPSNFKVFGQEAFGEWEKYTLGMGSKLMAKMGYIQGGGLGKNGEGRLEPVDVAVYPSGLSLDTCMEIRESSGRKALTVEEKLKRQSKQVEKNYMRQQNGRKTVFDFLNVNLKTKSADNSSFSISKTSKNVVQINKASSSTLNKSLLSVGENIIQIKKKISKLKEGLQRQSSVESTVANNLKEKIKCAEKELDEMEKREGSLLNERKNRHEKKKLAVF